MTFGENHGCTSTMRAGNRSRRLAGREREVIAMTVTQKKEAERLFDEGRTYKEIGELLGITPESVKQFFYRRRKQHVSCLICDQCHQPIKLNSNRHHRFCSYSCRMKWWQRHPEEYSNKDQHCFYCKTCGKMFYSRRAASYCSRPCYYESRKRKKLIL